MSAGPRERNGRGAMKIGEIGEIVRALVGRPKELEELRDALRSLPDAQPPSRPVMDPAERGLLGAEIRKRAQAFEAFLERIAQASEAAYVERAAADARIASLG